MSKVLYYGSSNSPRNLTSSQSRILPAPSGSVTRRRAAPEPSYNISPSLADSRFPTSSWPSTCFPKDQSRSPFRLESGVQEDEYIIEDPEDWPLEISSESTMSCIERCADGLGDQIWRKDGYETETSEFLLCSSHILTMSQRPHFDYSNSYIKR